MSVRVMNMVFERYPNGGGEMLLALALADHAHDDGSNVYPSIKELAKKTRQSPRAVQYQLRRMEESGWIELVNAGDGGRGVHREYRISQAWIKGADISPIQKKDADIAPVETVHVVPERVQTTTRKGANDDKKGCKAFAPAYNHQEPSKEPSRTRGDEPEVTFAELVADGLPSDVATGWLAHRKRKKAPLTPLAWSGMKREAAKAGWTIEDATRKAISRNWVAFDADFVADKRSPNQPGTGETSWQRSRRERVAEMTGGLASRPAPGAATDVIEMERTDVG